MSAVCAMRKYQHFIGKRVEARYRAGCVYCSAAGTLAADDGSSIFIEEYFMQDGKKKMLRVEVPYDCLLNVDELLPEPPPHH